MFSWSKLNFCWIINTVNKILSLVHVPSNMNIIWISYLECCLISLVFSHAHGARIWNAGCKHVYKHWRFPLLKGYLYYVLPFLNFNPHCESYICPVCNNVPFWKEKYRDTGKIKKIVNSLLLLAKCWHSTKKWLLEILFKWVATWVAYCHVDMVHVVTSGMLMYSKDSNVLRNQLCLNVAAVLIHKGLLMYLHMY